MGLEPITWSRKEKLNRLALPSMSSLTYPLPGLPDGEKSSVLDVPTFSLLVHDSFLNGTTLAVGVGFEPTC
jgi:hypothetical protein